MAPFVDGDDLTSSFKKVAELIAKEQGIIKRNVFVANPKTKTDYDIFCSPDISWSQDGLEKAISKIEKLFTRPRLKLTDMHIIPCLRERYSPMHDYGHHSAVLGFSFANPDQYTDEVRLMHAVLDQQQDMLKRASVLSDIGVRSIKENKYGRVLHTRLGFR